MKRVHSDLAYELIRRKILSGEYSPGRRLPTEALSAETRVSRTPVREALQKLEADGLVSLTPYSSASVRFVGVQEFREMCELRLALEAHVAGLAAKNRSHTDLQEIKLAFDRMRESAAQICGAADRTPLLHDLQRADVRFHVGIMNAAKNDLLRGKILRLHSVQRMVLGPFRPNQPAPAEDNLVVSQDQMIADHQEIYDAIVAHDETLAKHLVRKHVQTTISKAL